MCISAILGIGSALIGAGSASKAADAQEAAANRDIAYQSETRDLIFDRYEPFYQSGQNALAAYNYEMGLGERPVFGGSDLAITEVPMGGGVGQAAGQQTGMFGMPKPQWAPEAQQYLDRGVTPPSYMKISDGAGQSQMGFQVGGKTFATRAEAEAYAKANGAGGTEYKGFTATPGYDFRVKQGIGAVDASAAARGGLNSGRTLQDLTSFGQGIASQEYGTYMNRLAGLSDGGMAAAGGQAGAATNAAAGTSNALAGLGNAQSAGAIGVGNALQGGISNALGAWQYQNSLNKGLTMPTATPGSGIW